MFNVGPAFKNTSAQIPVKDGLVGWWLATEGLSITSGEILTWADQSGNGNDWVDSGAGPSVATSVLNGMDVIHFDGSDDHMQQAAFLTGSSDGEMSVVCRRQTTANKGWHAFGSGSSVSHFMFGNLIYESFGTNSRVNNISPGADFGLNAWGVYTVGIDATSHTVWTNGTQRSNVSRSRSWNSTFYLGSGDNGGTTGGTRSFQGEVAEMAVWNRKLSSSERADVLTYYQEKWGV